DAFIPRAFSLTHVNLTHRNWTAVGLPDCEELPIVDPRGLVTPFWDEWSLDTWILSQDGNALLPSRTLSVVQRLDISSSPSPAVLTESRYDNFDLVTRTDVQPGAEQPVCRLTIKACSRSGGWAVVALRPYNPEGISFIYKVELSADRREWTIDGKRLVQFQVPADRHHVSSYRDGDVYIHLRDAGDEFVGRCEVGMVTAAALFELEPSKERQIEIHIPLKSERKKMASGAATAVGSSWTESLKGRCQLHIPDERFMYLYDTALTTLILSAPGEVYPGPYTYKRFWFRDAVFIVHALLCAGLLDRAERALNRFPLRQTSRGYFHSQEGEWDSNGEVLWIVNRFSELTGRSPKADWWPCIKRGAHWICKKRLAQDDHTLHSGLMPAGFSAEHFGPSDYYYWDDFWGIAGLHAAVKLAEVFGDDEARREYRHQADSFASALEQSLGKVAERQKRPAMPASPYRRLDAGAIGSLAASYPLQLFSAKDLRVIDAVNFLIDECFVDGGFFQDMIHSGVNPYLTLHIAQVLLRAGDPRYFDLVKRVATLASPTGQWPEAIHPRTGGGCMGDGQHAWAAAEWVLMIRNCFVREEGDRLILGSGIAPDWLAAGEPLRFGPAPTSFGVVSLLVTPNAEGGYEHVVVSWKVVWHHEPARIEINVPGFVPAIVESNRNSIQLNRISGR
ncbi:MAG: hypothetical protein OEU36_21120, partial [Gammaproteobacteria bacterium]|nr:hypothetical protein [Gammaproteobacteria bacterium]